MKAKKLQQIKDVGEEKDENLKEIVKMKEQIIARVEEVERNSVQQVQKKHDKIVRAIKTDIDSIDVKLNAVQSNIEKVNAFKGDNEAKLFVVLNKAHEVEVSSSSFIDENGKGDYNKIDFVVNQDIATFVGKIDAFGNVKADEDREKGHTVATYSQIHVAEASLVSQVSVKGKDSCILDNGQIIILVNEGLIRLDKTYKLLDECNLSGAINLCQVGPTEITVLCSDTITFVDAGKSLLISRSLSLYRDKDDMKKRYLVNSSWEVDQVQCFGLTVSNEKLFVCDKLLLYYNGYRYTFGVSVYDLEGCHIETHVFLSDEKDDIGIYHATFSSYNSCMYISTSKKGILVFDMINKTLSEVTHKRLWNAYCFCEGRNGQYFVCGRGLNNIFLVDRKNNTMEEILGSIDGIRDPVSVMYIKQENRLLVTSASPDVKVYQLK
jgi:hypothetical protein